MNEPSQAGQKSSTSHPPASKPVSLAPLKFEEAVTALSRVVPQHSPRQFTSPEYIAVRSSLNSMIRFAHNITLPNFMFILIHRRKMKKETNLYRAINAIKDYGLKCDIEVLVAKATFAIVIMMISRSLFCVAIFIIAIPVCIIVWCVEAVRARLRVLINRLGNIIQYEVEYATD